jgi:hypothetical protein
LKERQLKKEQPVQEDDIPPPERGSPHSEPDQESGEAEKKIERGEVKDPNPLAPPVNTQAGS